MNQHEWRNQASLADYPFVSGSSRAGAGGGSRVSTADIVDAHLVARTGDESGFHISEIDVSSALISGIVSTDTGPFGTFSIPRNQSSGGAARVIDEVGVDRGVIILGRADQPLFELLSIGVTEFDPEALRFHDAVVFRPPGPRVATLSINDVPLYGRVRLKAGTGIRLELMDDAGKDVIVVHAVGAQSEEACGSGKPIKNFNSVPPNEYGTIMMRPAPYMTPEGAESLRQLLRIRPSDDNHGIIISFSELNR